MHVTVRPDQHRADEMDLASGFSAGERWPTCAIALSVCPGCSRGHQLASGELVPVGAEVVAMAECDAQHLGTMPAPVVIDGPLTNDKAVAITSDKPAANES